MHVASFSLWSPICFTQQHSGCARCISAKPPFCPISCMCAQMFKAEGAGVPSQLDADIASKEEEIASLQHEVCMETWPWPKTTASSSKIDADCG